MSDSQQTVARLFGQTEGDIEERCLQLFTESIRKAHQSGHNKWGVTHIKNDRVRLNVGGIVACTLGTGGIWFALDGNETGTSDKPYLNRLASWNWTPIKYSVVPSVSGYYKPSMEGNHEETWWRIRRMHFALIDRAADKYRRLSKKIQPAHSSEFLNYLRDRLDQADIPDPLY